MFPNTKNFSELTDIDTSHALVVEINLRVNGNIQYQFTVNDQLVTDHNWHGEFDLKTPLTFTCVVSKCELGHSGIDIQKITVNGIEVLPLYCGRAIPPTSYIGDVGLWTFAIPEPFYVWHHQISGQGWIA